MFNSFRKYSSYSFSGSIPVVFLIVGSAAAVFFTGVALRNSPILGDIRLLSQLDEIIQHAPSGALVVNPAGGEASVIGNLTVDGGLTVTDSGSFGRDIAVGGSITSGVWRGSTIAPPYGGTGMFEYAPGDLLYAAGTDTLARLAIGQDGQVLKVVDGLPAWSDISVGSGTGTITNVTAGSGLLGGGSSGKVTLSLNTAAANTWTGVQKFASGLQVTSGDLLVGTGTFENASASEDLYVKGNLEVDGSIYGSISLNPGFSLGSVAFQGASGLAEDNGNFYWDDPNNRLQLGIGPSASGYSTVDRLHIYGTGSGSGTEMAALRIGKETGPRIVAVQEAVDNDVQGLAFFTHDSLTFADPAEERMRIDNTGNVGIGTSSPVALLTVDPDASYSAGLLEVRKGGVSRLGVSNAGQTILRLHDTGSTALAYPLALHHQLTSGSAGVGFGTGIQLWGADGTNSNNSVEIGALQLIQTAANASNAYMAFYNKRSGSTAESFRLTETGDAWVRADAGKLLFGNAGDTNLYRVSANTLKTDDALDVAGALFQINSSGNLTKINNVAYSWPGSQGGASTVLTNDGAGNLSWAAGGGGGAPTGASYLTLGLDATLSAERVLSAGTNIAFSDGGANGNLTVNTVANPSFATSVTTPLLTTASGDLTIDPTGNTIIKGSTADNTTASLNVQNSASTSLLYARNDGNIGIGVTAPGNFLDISSGSAQFVTALNVRATTHVTSRRAAMNVGDWIIGQDTNGNGTKDFFLFDVIANTQRIFIDTSGRVGLNTITPQNRLDVEGAAAIGATYSGTNAAPTNGLIVEGNVAIGTATPDAAAVLHIHKASDDVFSKLSGTSGNIIWGVWNNPGADPNYTSGFHGFVGTVTNHPFAVRTNNVERLAITTTGLTGINTRTPDFRLDVSGDIRIESANKLYFGGTGAADNDVNLYRSAANVLKTDDSLEVVANFTLAGQLITTPSTTQTLVAANAISANAAKVKVAGSGGAVTLTSTPTIADGSDGQYLIIQGTNDTNTITVQDQGTLALSNLELGAATRVLGKGDVLVLSFDTTDSVWYEVSFTNN